MLKIGSHILGWSLLFTLILSVSATMGANSLASQLQSPEFFVFCFVYLFIFYFNGKVLFPKLYLQKKYFYYFSVILILLIAVYLLTPFDNLLGRSGPSPGKKPPPAYSSNALRPPQPKPPPRMGHRKKGPPIDVNSIILFVLVWLASTSLQILKEWRNTQQRAIIAETDKKTAELAFLKAHINPHFLFNTLNNIYSLAIAKDESTGVSILKLSNIMRYITENATNNFISLEDEVECIADYIDLQKLRLSKKVYLDFSITGNTQDKVIAPLILLSFIENTFKYGISNHHQSTITIKLFIEEKTITFYCQNKIFNPDFIYDREGLGIENTKRRLEFLYPGKHSLNISTENNLYTVQLTLIT